MGSKTKASAFAAPSYVEFEPYCEWQKAEGVENLIIQVPSFKKDEMKVHVTNYGMLKISGEKVIDRMEIRHFVKEAKIPQGCDIKDIQAKIKNGYLHIIMPKKVAPTAPQAQLPEIWLSLSVVPQAAKSQDTQKVKVDNPGKKVGVTFGIAVMVVNLALVMIGAYAACKWGSGSNPSSSYMEESGLN